MAIRKKMCSGCLELKAGSDFTKDARGRFGLASRCRDCLAASRKRDQRQYLQKRKMAAGKLIFEYLLQNPCVDCGYNDPRALDFDHVPELGEKRMPVSEMVNKVVPLHEIRLEMSRCQVRCRNCHQIRTHEENQSWRHQLWMRLMTEVYMTSRRVVPYEQQFYEDLMTK